jgi:hypothetical protein
MTKSFSPQIWTGLDYRPCIAGLGSEEFSVRWSNASKTASGVSKVTTISYERLTIASNNKENAQEHTEGTY